jgi:hypothetical protein
MSFLRSAAGDEKWTEYTEKKLQINVTYRIPNYVSTWCGPFETIEEHRIENSFEF